MRILYVTTISGTINSFLIPHIKLLLKLGHKVDAACNFAHDLSKELKNLGVRAFNIEFSRSPLKLMNLSAYKKIKRLVLKEQYDLVHVHTPVASFVTRLAARRMTNIKVIYTAHGFHFFKGASILSGLIYRTFEKLAARWTDGIITINREDYKAAQKFKLRRGGSIHYIPGVGIEADRFKRFGPNERNELRQRLGFSENDFIMLFTAELNRNKHQDLLIKAVKQLKDKGINVTLLLAGRGELRDKYVELANELGAGNEVLFLGERDDIDVLLQAADVALSSSRREGLPLYIMEAMAAGLPVVATNCRGNRDLVSDGQNGFLVQVDDEAGFALAIEQLYNSKELRRSLGEKGQSLVKAYTLDKVLASLKDIYSIYLKPKGKGTFVLSLDTELAWGSFDLGIYKRLRGELLDTRRCITKLLMLLKEHNIAVTFAFVGHLMLDSCTPVKGKKHNNLVRPEFYWYPKDWFSEDPASSIIEDPLWYGRDILFEVLRAHPKHEIGSHSFSHIIFGAPGCSRACAESDIKECVLTAGKFGLKLRSFVYPRNYAGHQDVLFKYGFRIYRGLGNEWYLKIKNTLFRKLCHIIDELFGLAPDTSIPFKEEIGLYNTIGNMLYLSRNGLRRLIPVSSRVKKAIRGINRAIEKGEVFHLWFHPFNLASDPKGLLSGLDRIFAYVRQKINEGVLENCTMEQLYERYSSLNISGE